MVAARRLPVVLGSGLAALALPLVALPGAAQAAPVAAKSDGQTVLTVVHGVRGLVADVRLDGKLVLKGFAPERVTDPLTLPAGEHRVQAWRSGASGGDPVLDATIDLPAGGQVTAGIGLDANGKPFVKVYDDRALLREAGSTALAVRGLADAEDVDVTADGREVARGLDAKQEESTEVRPGTYEVSAVDGGDSGRLVPPQDVPVAAGRAVVLYLIGSQEDDTLGWVAQTVRPSAAAAPSRVDTGVGPLPQDGAPRGGLVALLLVPAGLLLARRAARSRA